MGAASPAPFGLSSRMCAVRRRYTRVIAGELRTTKMHLILVAFDRQDRRHPGSERYE